MALYLRQICLVADRLAPAVRDLGAIFSIQVGHVDPEVATFGLENTLLPVGNQFLEVVAPVRGGTAAGRFLERRGGGGYMVICQVSTLEEQAQIRDRALRNGVRVAFEMDRGTWNIMQLHPADMGASFFEADWDQQADPVGNWEPAGGQSWKDAVSTEVVSAVVGAELQSDQPETLAARWAAVAGLPVEHRNRIPTIRLANGELRFVEARDGRGNGLGGMDLRVVDRRRLQAQAEAAGIPVVDDQVAACGIRFNLVD